MTTNASAEENGEFRVGMEAGYAPLTGHRKMTHMAQCLFKATLMQVAMMFKFLKIADGLGRKLVIVQTKWDGLAPALQSGKIDAIIAGMSPTAERKKKLLYKPLL